MAGKRIQRARVCLVRALTMCVALSAPLEVAHSRDAGGNGGSYDPSQIETVIGEVARVETLPRAGGADRDVMLVLRTSFGDEVPVAVAPRWVVKAKNLDLQSGDPVQVTGWRIVRGKPAVLAAEIRTGGRTFRFRDRHGVPVWGRRRRLTS